jgi:plastocyanin
LTELARIPADVSRRIVVLASVAAVLAAACASLPLAEVNFGRGRQFVPQVVDWQDNVGVDPALAVTKDGVPYVSSFGFNQVLKEGEVALPRPVGAPWLPGVLLADYQNGLWNRGAVAEPLDQPANVHAPFGPQTIASLKTLTPQNVNGTDVAVDDAGNANVVWTGNDGVWYASAAPTASTAEQIYKYGFAIKRAGPIGSPSIALDSGGNPMVAFGVVTSKHEVRFATKSGDTWNVQTIATARACGSCSGPGLTKIVQTSDGPLVLYVDQAKHAVMAATQQGTGWTTQQVEGNVTGDGLDLAVNADGTPVATYASGSGEIRLATLSGGSWSVTKVGSADTEGAVPQQTGVAIDDSGTIYIAWVLGGAIQLVSTSDGKSFTEIATKGTRNGQFPTVGVTGDGSKVFLAWYEPAQQDLQFGSFGETGSLAIAATSPPPFNTAAPATSGPAPTCPNGALQLTAPTGAGAAGFAETTLAASAKKPIEICFDNQDPSVTHNVEISKTPGDFTGSIFAPASNAGITGPAQTTYDVGKVASGQYSYYCFFHPTTMTGTLTVK